ncbi:MAG: hypothetical protein GY953_34420, partial [bacterium]|nr:hypothetical protein [bacterium]
IARFDAERDTEIKLLRSGDTLAPGAVRNPMAVVANYFFDCLPQDVFHFRDGRMFECLLTLASSQKEPDSNDPEILGRLEYSYDHEAASADYYDQPEWNRMLAEHRERLDGTTTTMGFPTAGLRCIDAMRRLSGDRMLLLSADKGYSRKSDLVNRPEPRVAVHGNFFSMMVNYYALARYVARHGGRALHAKHRETGGLNVSAFLFDPDREYVETTQAYREFVEQFGPDAFFTLKKGIEELSPPFNVAQFLAYLRLSGWDAKILLNCRETLLAHARKAPDWQKRQLRDAIWQVWDHYYPLGDEPDLALHLGQLLHEMNFDREALEFIDHSVRWYGLTTLAVELRELCRRGLGKSPNAAVS